MRFLKALLMGFPTTYRMCLSAHVPTIYDSAKSMVTLGKLPRLTTPQ